MNYHHLHFKEIDSTNNYLKNSYRLLNNFTFVSADYQSNGKGRYNRTWNSEPGENLMFSVLIKDTGLLKHSSIISLLVAVEVAKALEAYKIKDVAIKWPNDVLIGDKKVCGILAEGKLPEYLVVGTGINVNQKNFPDSLRRPATSLCLELKQDISVDELKNKLFNQITNALNNLNLEESLKYFREHNYLLGKRVKAMFDNQEFIGEVFGVDDSFCLQIKSRDILLHIDSGEIGIL